MRHPAQDVDPGLRSVRRWRRFAAAGLPVERHTLRVQHRQVWLAVVDMAWPGQLHMVNPKRQAAAFVIDALQFEPVEGDAGGGKSKTMPLQTGNALGGQPPPPGQPYDRDEHQGNQQEPRQAA